MRPMALATGRILQLCIYAIVELQLVVKQQASRLQKIAE